jgi:hypothetical protein
MERLRPTLLVEKASLFLGRQFPVQWFREFAHKRLNSRVKLLHNVLYPAVLGRFPCIFP